MLHGADRADNLDQPLGGSMKKSLVVGSLLALGVAAPATAQELEELNFGIISTELAQALQESFQPFLDDLQAYMGVPVKAFFAPDYAGVIEAMRFDKVDLAWFGNKSAMEAVDRAGGEVFAQTIKDDGSEGYYSLLITHVDSPIKSLDDVLTCDQIADLRQRRPQLDLGLSGAELLRLRAQRRRSRDLLQVGAERQPRDQRARGRQQAGRRRDQQHRNRSTAASPRPSPRPPPRSGRSGARR